MSEDNNSLNAFNESTGKYNKNQLKLWNYLRTLKKAPKIIEHDPIAQSFEVKKYREVFKNDAEYRIFEVIGKKPNTAATIANLTGLEHKYICPLKRRLEKSKKLEVVYLGQCPTTLRRGIQFLSVNINKSQSD